MRIQAKTTDNILIELSKAFGWTKWLEYYIEYLKKWTTGSEVADMYLESKWLTKGNTSVLSEEKLKEQIKKEYEEKMRKLEEQDEEIIERLEWEISRLQEKIEYLEKAEPAYDCDKVIISLANKLRQAYNYAVRLSDNKEDWSRYERDARLLKKEFEKKFWVDIENYDEPIEELVKNFKELNK